MVSAYRPIYLFIYQVVSQSVCLSSSRETSVSFSISSRLRLRITFCFYLNYKFTFLYEVWNQIVVKIPAFRIAFHRASSSREGSELYEITHAWHKTSFALSAQRPVTISWVLAPYGLPETIFVFIYSEVKFCCKKLLPKTNCKGKKVLKLI
jgi:hypothetical protein